MAHIAPLNDVHVTAGVDLRGPSSTLQAISVLAAIVTIHELGHFIAARSQNIHVTKFSIGFGPKLFSYQVSSLVLAPSMQQKLTVMLEIHATS